MHLKTQCYLIGNKSIIKAFFDRLLHYLLGLFFSFRKINKNLQTSEGQWPSG